MSSKKYSRDFKLKVLEYYFEHGGDKKFGLKAKTAHHFCIDHKTVSRMLCNPDIVKKARRILLKKNGTEGSKTTKHSSLKIGQPFVNVQKIDSDFKSRGRENVSPSSSKPKKVAANQKSPEVQIIDLPEDPDYSLLKKAIDSSASSVANIAKLLFTGTDEVKRIITNECDLIYECKICRNLFRSVVNFLAHKRIYCQEEYVNVKGSFYKNTGLNMTSESSTVIVEPEPPPDSPPIIEGCKESSLKVDQIAARLAKNKTKQPAQETSHPSHKGSSKYFQSIEEVNHSRKSLSSDCSVVLRDIAGVSSAVYQAINQPGNKVTRRSTNHQRKSDRPLQLDPEGQVIERNKVSESLTLPEKTAVICKEEPPDEMEVIDFSCSSCELTFSSQSLLNAHVEQVHGIERTVYTCPICNMTFFSIWGCVKHLIRIHKKKKHQRERLKHVICSRAYKKTFTAKEIVKQNYKSAAQILKDVDKKEESAPSSPSSVSSLQDAKSSEREDFPLQQEKQMKKETKECVSRVGLPVEEEAPGYIRSKESLMGKEIAWECGESQNVFTLESDIRTSGTEDQSHNLEAIEETTHRQHNSTIRKSLRIHKRKLKSALQGRADDRECVIQPLVLKCLKEVKSSPLTSETLQTSEVSHTRNVSISRAASLASDSQIALEVPFSNSTVTSDSQITPEVSLSNVTVTSDSQITREVPFSNNTVTNINSYHYEHSKNVLFSDKFTHKYDLGCSYLRNIEFNRECDAQKSVDFVQSTTSNRTTRESHSEVSDGGDEGKPKRYHEYIDKNGSKDKNVKSDHKNIDENDDEDKYVKSDHEENVDKGIQIKSEPEDSDWEDMNDVLFLNEDVKLEIEEDLSSIPNLVLTMSSFIEDENVTKFEVKEEQLFQEELDTDTEIAEIDEKGDISSQSSGETSMKNISDKLNQIEENVMPEADKNEIVTASSNLSSLVVDSFGTNDERREASNLDDVQNKDCDSNPQDEVANKVPVLVIKKTGSSENSSDEWLVSNENSANDNDTEKEISNTPKSPVTFRKPSPAPSELEKDISCEKNHKLTDDGINCNLTLTFKRVEMPSSKKESLSSEYKVVKSNLKEERKLKTLKIKELNESKLLEESSEEIVKEKCHKGKQNIVPPFKLFSESRTLEQVCEETVKEKCHKGKQNIVCPLKSFNESRILEQSNEETVREKCHKEKQNIVPPLKLFNESRILEQSNEETVREKCHKEKQNIVPPLKLFNESRTLGESSEETVKEKYHKVKQNIVPSLKFFSESRTVEQSSEETIKKCHKEKQNIVPPLKLFNESKTFEQHSSEDTVKETCHKEKQNIVPPLSSEETVKKCYKEEQNIVPPLIFSESMTLEQISEEIVKEKYHKGKQNIVPPLKLFNDSRTLEQFSEATVKEKRHKGKQNIVPPLKLFNESRTLEQSSEETVREKYSKEKQDIVPPLQFFNESRTLGQSSEETVKEKFHKEKQKVVPLLKFFNESRTVEQSSEEMVKKCHKEKQNIVPPLKLFNESKTLRQSSEETLKEKYHKEKQNIVPPLKLFNESKNLEQSSEETVKDKCHKEKQNIVSPSSSEETVKKKGYTEKQNFIPLLKFFNESKTLEQSSEEMVKEKCHKEKQNIVHPLKLFNELSILDQSNDEIMEKYLKEKKDIVSPLKFIESKTLEQSSEETINEKYHKEKQNIVPPLKLFSELRTVEQSNEETVKEKCHKGKQNIVPPLKLFKKENLCVESYPVKKKRSSIEHLVDESCEAEQNSDDIENLSIKIYPKISYTAKTRKRMHSPDIAQQSQELSHHSALSSHPANFMLGLNTASTSNILHLSTKMLQDSVCVEQNDDEITVKDLDLHSNVSFGKLSFDDACMLTEVVHLPKKMKKG